MVERPAPVRDLDWDPERARAFTDRTADLFEELLMRLRDLPVSRDWGTEEVRKAVSLPVPDEPMSDDELFEYLRQVTFDHSGSSGTRGSTRTSPAPAPVRERRRICWRRG